MTDGALFRPAFERGREETDEEGMWTQGARGELGVELGAKKEWVAG